jgi:hypothetical protein
MSFRVLGAWLASLVLAATAGQAGELGDFSTLTSTRSPQDGSIRFTIGGQAPVFVVIRGLGPSLVDQKTLSRREAISDPKLVLLLNGSPVASNDDWRDHPSADLIPEALQPPYDAEAALALTLAPGEYVAVVQDAPRRSRRHARSRLGAVTVSKPESSSDESTCTNVTPICESVHHNDDSVTCTLSVQACAVDLELLVEELVSKGFAITTDTPMVVGATGGAGGRSADDGAGGGRGGYAQTITSVADVKTGLGTTQLYYFLGANGAEGPSTCGGAGGTATIVTAEDLRQNPDKVPDSDDVLLIAGGGGGGGGQNEEGFCLGGGQSRGGAGGGALADSDRNATDHGLAAGGCPPEQGSQGQSCTFASGADAPGDGTGGYGGLGAAGGLGSACQPSGGPTPFRNAGVLVLSDSGMGGRGGGGDSSCDSGGGGGGGGYGGGGGGGHGNDVDSSAGGAGGGSFARAATQKSSQFAGGCTSDSCVRILFDLTK